MKNTDEMIKSILAANTAVVDIESNECEIISVAAGVGIYLESLGYGHTQVLESIPPVVSNIGDEFAKEFYKSKTFNQRLCVFLALASTVEGRMDEDHAS